MKTSHGKITKAGHEHWHFPEKFFQKISKAHRICDAFLVFDRKVLLCSISEPAINRNSEENLLKNFPEKKCVGKVPF